uniref:Letm1 RBD domain-containing protein n=1 Tax=Oncorhynchus tshawytscha TaxID=74940 RepID=A0A8C8CIU4_ONCTS
TACIRYLSDVSNYTALQSHAPRPILYGCTSNYRWRHGCVPVRILHESSETSPSPAENRVLVPTATSSQARLNQLGKRVADELKHYYHGCQLLGIDTNIARRMVWRLLHGQPLTRRERRRVKQLNPQVPSMHTSYTHKPAIIHSIESLVSHVNQCSGSEMVFMISMLIGCNQIIIFHMIATEGVAAMSVSELQVACRSRGMKSLGLTTEQLMQQLQQWLALHLKENVPPSLLLLSHAMYHTDLTPKSPVILPIVKLEQVAAPSPAEIEAPVKDKPMSVSLEVLVDSAPIIMDRKVHAGRTSKLHGQRGPLPFSPFLSLLMGIDCFC